MYGFQAETIALQKPIESKKVRGLVWDIETSPLIAYTWGMYEDSVIEVIEDYQILMMVHGLTPPSPYKQLDTKKIVKRVAGFTSNRLKHLATDLHVAQKGDPGGFGTWKGCLAGDPKAWAKMKKYNRQDIPPLMDLYMKFRAWDNQGYNLNVALKRQDACPKCGGKKMNAGMKYHSTKTGAYQYFRCTDCGGMAKSRIPEPKTTQERMQYV